MSVDSLAWDELEEGEEQLTDLSELNWRQVHPLRVNASVISSEAFSPGSSDVKKLSCTRESVVTAEQAHRGYVLRGLASAGSAAISVNEVESPITSNGATPTAALRVIDDSKTGDPDKPLPFGHTYVDYRPIGSSRIDRKAKQLAWFANKRGGLRHSQPNGSDA